METQRMIRFAQLSFGYAIAPGMADELNLIPPDSLESCFRVVKHGKRGEVGLIAEKRELVVGTAQAVSITALSHGQLSVVDIRTIDAYVTLDKQSRGIATRSHKWDKVESEPNTWTKSDSDMVDTIAERVLSGQHKVQSRDGSILDLAELFGVTEFLPDSSDCGRVDDGESGATIVRRGYSPSGE